MSKLKISDFIRWLLTGYLLYIVWNNSHWSVALAITLMCVANELTAASLQLITKCIKKIANI